MLAEQFRYKILEALYEAPLDPSRWEEFLRLTAKAAQGEAATLITHDYGHTESDMATQWGCNPEMPQLYAAHYGAIDVWREAVTASADWLGISEQFVPSQSLAKTEIYNDFLVPYEIPHGIFAMIARSPSRVVNLSILRGSNLGPFETTDLEIVRFLRPHIQRAYRLYSELTKAKARSAGLMACLDSFSCGVILLGPQMQVLAMNRAAERLTKSNNGLQVSRSGLGAERPGETAQLHRLVVAALATSKGRGLDAAGAMTVSRREQSPIHLLVSPVRGIDLGYSDRVGAIVFINDPAQHVHPREETLRAIFGLTTAECRVAVLLADGRATAEIGHMLDVSRNTLKSQLASIYGKTGTSRQSQLVRLLLQLAVPETTSVRPLSGA